MYRLFTRNCVTRAETLLASFLMYVIFRLPDCCFPRSEFNNTLLYQNGGWEQLQEHQHPSPIILEFRHSSPSLYKLTKGFVFSSCRWSKQSASRLLTLNWPEHFIWCGCFLIYSGNNNTSLLLYACEVLHLINKSVTSPYVQKQGGLLLKPNILRLH